MMHQIILIMYIIAKLSVGDDDIRFLNVTSQETVSSYFKYDQIYTINITVISNNTRGIILYAISRGTSVSLSLDKRFSAEDSITGSSVAIIQLLKVNKKLTVFYLFLNSNQSCYEEIEEVIDIVAIELTSKDPLPGGCNLVYQPNFYPILNSSLHRLAFKINYQPANVGFSFNQKKTICDHDTSLNKGLVYDVYIDFLSEDTFYNVCCKAEKNFTKNLLQKFENTWQNQKTSSVKVMTHHQNGSKQFVFAYNPCLTTMIYVNVRDPERNGSSFYAPSVIGKDNCSNFNTLTQLFIFFVFLLAIMLCFIGHRIFAFELLMFGSLFSFILCFIVVEIEFNITVLFKELAICIGVALLFGFTFVALWWRFGYAQFYCIFIGFVGGFLLASIIFSSPLINIDAIQFKTAFVCLFLSVVVLYCIVMGCWPSKGCIVSSAFVGSYLAVFSLTSGVFLCSGISFIVPFSLLRFTDAQMEFAYVIFSLTIIDVVVITSWLLLFFLGCLIQLCLMRDQPDFPECPYASRMQQCHLTIPSARVSLDDSESLSSRGPSFTSENYEGDVSDELNGLQLDSSDSTSTSDDTTPLCR